MRSARIVGTGSYLPEQRRTNLEIEKLVPGTSATWTASTLGILERRIATEEQSTAHLAVGAARRALDDAKMTPRDIDLIIVGTATPHRLAPSTACYVQRQLGINRAAAFDLGAVCSSFVYAVTVALQFIRAGQFRTALVIGADTFSKITDWSRRDCVFFGDGAGAAILAACPAESGFLSCDLGADGSGWESWTVPAGGSECPASTATVAAGRHFWQMDGKAVYQMALERIPQTVERSLRDAGIDASMVDHVIPHQPNVRILRDVADLIHVPFSKFHVNMDCYANTAAASVAIALDDAKRGGSLSSGQIILLVAVGAGWTWGSMVLRWA